MNGLGLFVATSGIRWKKIVLEGDNPIFKSATFTNVKSGATQVAAEAEAGQIWKTLDHATLPDNVLMLGV